jgi:hypothetical protein
MGMYTNPDYIAIRKKISETSIQDLLTRAFACYDFMKHGDPYSESTKDAFFDSWGSPLDVRHAKEIHDIKSLESKESALKKLQEIKQVLVAKSMFEDITKYESAIIQILDSNHDNKNLGALIGLVVSIPKYFDNNETRDQIEEAISKIRHVSQPVGSLKKRANFKLKFLSFKDLKYRGFAVVQAIHNDKDMVFFFQSNEDSQYGKAKTYDDFAKMTFGQEFTVRATPASHGVGKYTNCMETKLNRIVWC